MRFLSVCSGIEAASVAWRELGWEPAAFAEVDPFASALLAHHYPEVPNLGDFTKIGADDIGAVDLLVGGTPCQDFSVAGLRAGMDGARGQLTVEFVELARRVRPRWVVWENVPGVLSIDEGRAFGTFLGLLADVGYGFAYRVLDAQFFGVPQRRRRVFVVGCLGDWRRAAAVLFERASLSGHPTPRRETRKDVAGTLSSRSTAGGGLGTDFEIDGGLTAVDAAAYSPGSFGTYSEGVKALRASSTPAGKDALLVASALTASAGHHGHSSPRGDGSDNLVIAFDETQITHPANRCNPQAGDPSHPLAAGARPPTIAFGAQVESPFLEETALPVTARNGDAGMIAFTTQQEPKALDDGMEATMHVLQSSAVRRLTPRECERLQGFPDDSIRVTIHVCEECASQPFALRAENDSLTCHRDRVEPVALSALIDCDRSALVFLSLEKSNANANGVDGFSESRRLTLPADTVVKFVRMLRELARTTKIGAVDSPPCMKRSLLHANGSAFVLKFGCESVGCVSVAPHVTAGRSRCSTSTTPPSGADTPTFDSILQTLCCFAVGVIGGFTLGKTSSGSSFDVDLTVTAGYTLVPYRKKPAADGPRYHALGNSFAVPVVRWIGERIAMVEQLSGNFPA